MRLQLERSGDYGQVGKDRLGAAFPVAMPRGGFALLSLYFAGWAAGRPALRWQGLGIGVGAGILFGTVRILQGAHFESATIWSAEVGWSACALLFLPLLCSRARRV